MSRNKVAIISGLVAIILIGSISLVLRQGDEHPEAVTEMMALKSVQSTVENWVGGIDFSSGKKPVVASLCLTESGLGESAGEMAMKSPWDCELGLENGLGPDGQPVLNIVSTNGGRCDSYREGYLMIDRAPEGNEMVIQMFKAKDHEPSAKGTLRRSD